jgi:hypothetical protein
MMRIALCLVFALLPCTAATTQPVTTPSQHLGRPLGADFELADWAEVSSYFRKLAEESPRVQTTQIGTSTEGREFLLSVISSPENLDDLERIRARAAVLADPRGRTEAELADAVANGKVILLVSCALHATETAAPSRGGGPAARWSSRSFRRSTPTDSTTSCSGTARRWARRTRLRVC